PDAQSTDDNRSKLNTAYFNQSGQQSRNIVNELGSHFEDKAEPKPAPAKDAAHRDFNSNWLENSKLKSQSESGKKEAEPGRGRYNVPAGENKPRDAKSAPPPVQSAAPAPMTRQQPTLPGAGEAQ